MKTERTEVTYYDEEEEEESKLHEESMEQNSLQEKSFSMSQEVIKMEDDDKIEEVSDEDFISCEGAEDEMEEQKMSADFSEKVLDYKGQD